MYITEYITDIGYIFGFRGLLHTKRFLYIRNYDEIEDRL